MVNREEPPPTTVRAKAPTLRDVAARATVNPSVVSRVLNGDATLKIAAPTRQRVLEAVDHFDYRPNALARGLRMSRTSTIGLVLPEIANPVYGPILVGAQRRASEKGYVIIIGSGMDASSTEASFAQLLREGRVDGLLIASAALEDALIRELASGPAPVVVVNRRVDGVAGSVIVDDQAGSYLATDHLLQLGHSNIAHLAGPGGLDTTIRRRAGFESAMHSAGFQGVVISEEGWDAGAGHRAGVRLLRDQPTVTGVFAGNVMMAIGMVRAASEYGRVVPHDLSVIALHDFPLAGFVNPPLTTIVMPLEELGAAGVDMLLDRLVGGRAYDMVIQTPPHLMVRESTEDRHTTGT